MKYGICTLSVVPVRKDASDKSEMTTQLLFGDMVEFLDRSNQWILVKILYDDYEGWIDHKQITELTEEDHQKLCKASLYKVTDLVFPVVRKSDEQKISTLMGSVIPYQKNKSFAAGGQSFAFEPKAAVKKTSIKSIALKYLDAPYLWGGKSLFGIDCSGLTQMVFKLNGIRLPRDAYQQAEQGKTVDFINESLDGDLAFFDNPKGQIIHTGIILGNNTIIHASGRVRIDTIDHQGIYNEAEKKYTHKLRIIKRVL
jgi:cell wall-associated NlpC family hydrolase